MSVFALPLIAGAQGLENVESIGIQLKAIVASLIPIAFTAAVLFFFWGLALYISAQGSEDKQDKGKGIMTWGIVAIFIMASIWGIVAFIGSALGIGQGTGVTVPVVF